MQRLLFATLVAATGCTQGSAPPVLTEPSLMQPLEMTATHPAAESSVSFDISSWKADSTARLALSPSDLRLVVRTGRHGELTGLELPPGDRDISAEAPPPSGLQLRNSQVS